MADGAPIFQTLWPMPGGSDSYLASLADVLRLASDATDTHTAVEALVQHFQNVTSTKAAYSYLRVPVILGLLDIDGPACDLSREGKAFLKRPTGKQLRRLLTERVAGVDDLLRLIGEKPRRIGLLHNEMNELGYGWTKQTQVRYRLRWLEAAGAIRREGAGRPLYRLTSAP